MKSPDIAATISATRPLSRLETSGLIVLVGVFLAFGVLVEWRTAFLSRRMGDLDCFLRAAWAVTVGESMYDVVSENGWHYSYPPIYAIAMLPLADPPSRQSAAGFVPFPVAVGLFYALNIVCLFGAVHGLAGALERRSSDPEIRAQPKFCRRWWALRVLPTLICLVPIGHSAMRGQVNTQVLLLLCGWIACSVGGKRLLGGSLLAMAASIKVVPVYLLVYPLWRREGRTLGGCLVGFVAALLLVPLIVLGPHRLASEYQHYFQVFLGPALHVSTDESRQHELLGVTATDSIDLGHAILYRMHPNPYQRPSEFPAVVVWAHRILGVLMTLAVLWPLRKRDVDPLSRVLGLGLLLLLMVIFSPVSHSHYLVFGLPLAMGLLMRRWQHSHSLWPGWTLMLAVSGFVAGSLVHAAVEIAYWREYCLPLYGMLLLWALGLADLWRTRQRTRQPTAQAPYAAVHRMAA
jgi:hypothetical protein